MTVRAREARAAICWSAKSGVVTPTLGTAMRTLASHAIAEQSRGRTGADVLRWEASVTRRSTGGMSETESSTAEPAIALARNPRRARLRPSPAAAANSGEEAASAPRSSQTSRHVRRSRSNGLSAGSLTSRRTTGGVRQ